MSANKAESEEKKPILRLYSVLVASIILSAVPSFIAAAFSLVLLVGGMVYAYRLKAEHDEKTLAYNHSLYIIRTIWISSLIVTVSVVIISFYMGSGLNHSPLDVCIESFIQTANPELIDYAMLEKIFMPCIGPYLKLNQLVFVIAAGILILPVLFYLIIRFGRGVSRAAKGYRIANPRGWL